jgi:uncharacterized protein (DUF2141 family)
MSALINMNSTGLKMKMNKTTILANLQSGLAQAGAGYSVPAKTLARWCRLGMFGAGLLLGGVAAANTLEVHLAGVTGGKGQVRIAVCDQAHFLKQCLHHASAPAQTGANVVRIDGIPAGKWAVLAYQDENQNSELDRNFVGIPSENYGFSRDAASRFGPPGFDDAAIDVQEAVTVLRITLH